MSMISRSLQAVRWLGRVGGGPRSGTVARRSWSAWFQRHRWLWVALLVYSAVMLAHFGFVPMWDGRIYVDECILPATEPPLGLLRLNCSDHPSMLGMLPVFALQYFDPGNLWTLHGVNLAVGLGGVVSFYWIARRLFPSPRMDVERGLVTLAYTSCPVIMANALNLNADYPVVEYALVVVALLLYRRYLLAIVAGFWLVFSKEVGVPVLLSIVGLHLVFMVWRRRRRLGWKVRESLWHLPLSLPPMALGVYFWHRSKTAGGPGVWLGGGGNGNLFEAALTLRTFDGVSLAYLRNLFVLNFGWLFTILVLLLVGYRLGQWALRRGWTTPRTLHPSTAHFVAWLFIAAVSIVMRLAAIMPPDRAFTNVRYMLVVYPFLYLVGGYAAVVVLRWAWLRRGFLALCAFATFVSMFRTVDPLSIWVYGNLSIR